MQLRGRNGGRFPARGQGGDVLRPGVRALAIYLLDRQHLPYERCAELLGEVLGVTVSTGWLCAIQHEADRLLVPFVEKLKLMIADAAVLHVDETGTAVGLDKHWVHTVTDGLVTLLEVHPERGRKAPEDIGVLGAYAGVLVHDGYASYDYLQAAAHAQCHAHLLRHLKDVARTDAYVAWTQQMIGVLLTPNTRPKQQPPPAGTGSPRPPQPGSGPATTPVWTRRSRRCLPGRNRACVTKADGRSTRAKPGTWPPACAAMPPTSCASSTTAPSPPTTTPLSDRFGW